MNHTEFSKTEAQAEMFANRLVKRQRHLKKWARRTGAGVYRLYDRDIPEIPLVLDWYTIVNDPSETAGSGITSGILAGSLYKRPYEKDDEEAWLASMKETAAAALAIPQEMIFLRERKKQQGAAQYEKFAAEEMWRVVREGGLYFWVNLSDYLDTGLFPDRRLLRNLVRRESAGCRVLNLFCYTASISVAAAAGGASAVDSVDLSNSYLAWAKDNFTLNGIQADMVRKEAFFNNKFRGACTLIRDDVLCFIEEARRRGFRWDRIILDPPAFSNSKKMAADFDLKRDHAELITKCASLLNPGGVLYFSANVKGFKLNLHPADVNEEPPLNQPKARERGFSITDITERLRDEDFRGKRIPLTWMMR